MTSVRPDLRQESSMPDFPHRLYGLRPTILTALLGLLLLAILPIIAYTYWQGRRAVLDLSDTLINQVSATTISTLTGRLWHAAKMTEMSSCFIEPYLDLLTENAELESYLVATLKVHPGLCNSFLADERGNFVAAQKFSDGTITTEIIDRTDNPPKRILRYRDAEGRVTATKTFVGVDFDPRVRPWYQGAKKSGKLFLTDMYVFYREKTPGVTFSAPVRNKQGNIVGVVGLDVELSMISDFLQTLKVGKSGIVFITDTNYRVLACTNIPRVVRWEKSDDPRLLRIDELGIGLLASFYKEHMSEGASKFSFEYQGKQFMGSITPFPEIFGNPWKVGVVVPEDDFLSDVKRANKFALILASAIFAIAIVLAIALGRSISQPIMYLSGAADKMRNFELDHAIGIRPRIKEIYLLATALSSMQTGLQAFKKYVPAELVRQLIRTGEAARRGGKKTELTFFFSDIAGFTPISEGMQPEALMIHISEYLDELTNIIMKRNGTVDKYIGDAIMAFWGAPVSDSAHAEHACDAALACQERIRELNAKWQDEGKAPLPTRIGIHTGKAIVGNVGSSERMNYTAIGDDVNLANRLEGANKFYGTGIIISQSVYEQVSQKFVSRPLDLVAVKGREQSIMIYELMGRKDDAPSEAVKFCKDFAEAFTLYLKRDWENALRIFSDIQSGSPSDPPTSLYLQRCQNLLQNPPGPSWNGITHMDSK